MTSHNQSTTMFLTSQAQNTSQHFVLFPAPILLRVTGNARNTTSQLEGSCPEDTRCRQLPRDGPYLQEKHPWPGPRAHRWRDLGGMEAHWNGGNLWLSPKEAAASSTTEITFQGLTASCASQEWIHMEVQHSRATRHLASFDFSEAMLQIK